MILPPFPVACSCGHVTDVSNIRIIKCSKCKSQIPRETVDAAYVVNQMGHRPGLIVADHDEHKALIEKVFGAGTDRPASDRGSRGGLLAGR